MEEKQKEYYKVISDNWQIFKAILKDYQPTEEFLVRAANFLTASDINSFDADIKQAILSELYRMVNGGNAYTDLLMLSHYADQIRKHYGVKVRIEIDSGDKKMEVKG